MALLLLLFGGFWTQVLSSSSLQNTTMLTTTPHIKVPTTSEALNVSSTISSRPETEHPQETTHMWSQTPPPPFSTPFETTELSSLGAPTDASTSTPVPDPTSSQEVSNKTSVQLPEASDVASDPPTTPANPMIDKTETFPSLDTFDGTSAPPITMTTSSKETSGPSVSTTVSSKSSGPPVTMTTGSLGLSSQTHGLAATIATRSVEGSSVAGGTPVSNIKISTMSTPEPITSRKPRRESSGTLLVPMLVAFLLALALLLLLVLWRRRQNRRTGALTLNRGGKRNGVVDAWAGPARVPDEEAATATASGPAGNKGSGAPETEGSGQRPMLTTFFSRRKSRQGSLVLEELKSGPGPKKGEEEPLVGSEDEAVETPTSDGPEAKDGTAPQSV
ncbi:leukosialin [Peromyscus eremicus]|uniref:leukosialin n=1 Tax=Peromyscus eremicus TaxID=42410 RepID=UPI0027DABE3F|nr:leukosialin [Peromyscus eremicus]